MKNIIEKNASSSKTITRLSSVAREGMGVLFSKQIDVPITIYDYIRSSKQSGQNLLEYYLRLKVVVRNGVINRDTSASVWMKMLGVKSKSYALKIKNRLIKHKLIGQDDAGNYTLTSFKKLGFKVNKSNKLKVIINSAWSAKDIKIALDDAVIERGEKQRDYAIGKSMGATNNRNGVLAVESKRNLSNPAWAAKIRTSTATASRRRKKSEIISSQRNREKAKRMSCEQFKKFKEAYKGTGHVHMSKNGWVSIEHSQTITVRRIALNGLFVKGDKNIFHINGQMIGGSAAVNIHLKGKSPIANTDSLLSNTFLNNTVHPEYDEKGRTYDQWLAQL